MNLEIVYVVDDYSDAAGGPAGVTQISDAARSVVARPSKRTWTSA